MGFHLGLAMDGQMSCGYGLKSGGGHQMTIYFQAVVLLEWWGSNLQRKFLELLKRVTAGSEPQLMRR
jgi:hypothetical protein